MKILIICHKNILNPLDGGGVASKKIFTDLQKKYRTDIICLNNKKDNVVEDNFNFNINTDFNLKKLVLSLFSKSSYQADRFFSKNILKKIIYIINEKKYDYVLFEGVFPAVYLNGIQKKCNCKTIIRTHNIEHEIWQNLQRNCNNLIKKIFYLFVKRQIKKWEDYICKKSDILCCISKNDTKYFNKLTKKNIRILPVSFKTNKSKKNNKFSVFHLGSMDWKPNIEGVNWFIEKVWPKFTQKSIPIYCYFAGKKMPNKIMSKSSNKLIIESTIQDAKQYMQNKSVMIVPIFSGSGIRIKILEGMALGIPIISTTKGAAGIPYKNEKNILIANNELDFYNSIIKLYSNPELYERISLEGRKLIQNNFSSNIVVEEWNNIVFT